MYIPRYFPACLISAFTIFSMSLAQAEVTLTQEMSYTDKQLNIKLPTQHMNIALYDGKLVSYAEELPQYITIYNARASSITGIWHNSRMWNTSIVAPLVKAEELNPHWVKTNRTSEIAGHQCQWYEANLVQEHYQACLVSMTTIFDPADAKTLHSVGLISEASSARDRTGGAKPTFVSPPKGFFALQMKGKGDYGDFGSKVTKIVKGAGKSIVLDNSTIPPGYAEFRN